MKNASKREQLGSRGDQAPDGGFYQRYAFRLISVLDYLRYLRAVNFPKEVTSVEDFATQLDNRHYFGNLAIYIGGLKRFMA